MSAIFKANEGDGVEATAQCRFLTAQEFVEARHPFVWLLFEKRLSQIRHELCRRDLVDVKFAHQVLANLGCLVLGDVTGQPSGDIRIEQRCNLFRAEQLAQFLSSSQLCVLGGDMPVVEGRKQFLVLKRLSDGVEHRCKPRVLGELLTVKRQAAQRRDIQQCLVPHPEHRFHQQAGGFLDQVLVPRLAGGNVVAAWRGAVRPLHEKAEVAFDHRWEKHH